MVWQNNRSRLFDCSKDNVGMTAVASENRLRQRWIGAFSRTPVAHLEDLDRRLQGDRSFQTLRPPEPGLVMVRARAGGTGQQFNAGEMTVTRCSVRTRSGTVGHGYVAGRDRRHAELAARLDAVMQELAPAAVDPILARLEGALAEAAAARQATSDPTRVEFYTLVRGEDP